MLRFARDSRPVRVAAAALAAGLLALVLSAGPVSADPNEGPRPVIARVLFRLDVGQAGPELEALALVKPGDPYSLKLVRDAVRRLYGSGLFSDIQVRRSSDPDVTLTFSLVRKLTVRSVRFQSAAILPTKELSESLSALKAGADMASDTMARAESEIKAVLKREGFFESYVQGLAVRDPQVPAVDITFEVAPGRRYTVDKLTFSGDVKPALKDVQKRMSTREGKPYIPSTLDKDRMAIESYYKSLGYQRVQVTLTETLFHEAQGTVGLNLRVDAGDLVKVVVRGASVPLSMLTRIWQERVFEEWGRSEGESRILAYLRKKGYLFAIVTSSVERQGPLLQVTYDIDPGDKYHIRSVVFEGMLRFSVKEIQSLLGFQEGLFALGGISGERVFTLPQEIEELYRSFGFAQASVRLDFYRKGRSVTAIFSLNEGLQQRVKDVTIVGASAFTPAELSARFSCRPGGPFVQTQVQKDAEKIRAFYLNQGFRESKVDVSAAKLEDDLFSVVYSVSEGRKVRVERIVITGQRVTRRETILRELRIREGDLARQDVILQSKRNLEKLGIFSEVKLEEVPLGPETVNLVISLREDQRNYAGLGIGLETTSAIRSADIWNNNLSPRITAELIRSNMFGNAAQLSLAAQYGLREKRGVLAFEQPHLFSLILHNSIDVMLERERRVSYEFERQGISFNAIKPLSPDIVLMSTVQWARTKLLSLDIAPSEVDWQFSPYSKTSLNLSLSYDRRDDALNPRSGSFSSASVELAFPLFGVESNFQKLFFKHQQFWTLRPHIYFSTLLRLGFGRGTMPIHERFFAGGSNSFRGEYFDELGPKDLESGKPVGGKLLTLLNFELTFPFILAVEDLSCLFFYEVGNVFASRDDFQFSALEHAIGFGLRYKTPLGPLRFEIGLNLNAPGGGRQVIPFITVGNMF